MITKTCYFVNVGITFDKENREYLKDCFNCNWLCCKSDLCNGLWCEDYGIFFNKDTSLDYIKNYVKNGVNNTYGYIKAIDLTLPEENWVSIYESALEEYNYSDLADVKKNGFIPFSFTDLIEDYCSYWEEPDVSYFKDKDKILKDVIHVYEEKDLNQDTMKWINKNIYGIEDSDEKEML